MKECMGKKIGRIHIPVGVFMREQFIYIVSDKSASRGLRIVRIY